jgi:hypothetical protein
MPGPIDDKQYPRRITLPTLNGKPPFMNTQNATTFGQRTNGSPFASSSPLPAQISSGNKSVMGPGYGPLPGGYVQAPQFLRGQTGPITAGGFGHSVPWNPKTDQSLFPGRAGTGGAGGGGYGRLGGDARIGSPFSRGGVGGTAGAGGFGGGAPGMSPLEAMARDRINKALGEGWYENFVKTRGMSPVDFYRDPRNKYWDEPDTPDGAINSAIRDEINNARNAAQWQQEHGNTPIGQEQWERWYYANRQGMRVDDVMNDGSEVVY